MQKSIVVVGGGRDISAGMGMRTKNEDLGKTIQKRKGENCTKNGVKGLKIALFWVINFKNFVPPLLSSARRI